MNLHERLVSAALGALSGAVLGLMLVLFFHYAVGSGVYREFSIADWKNTIAGCAVACAILGFIFKANAGSIIGTLMGWVWSAIEYHREIYKNNLLLMLLVLAVISYGFYTIAKD